MSESVKLQKRCFKNGEGSVEEGKKLLAGKMSYLKSYTTLIEFGLFGSKLLLYPCKQSENKQYHRNIDFCFLLI